MPASRERRRSDQTVSRPCATRGRREVPKRTGRDTPRSYSRRRRSASSLGRTEHGVARREKGSCGPHRPWSGLPSRATVAGSGVAAAGPRSNSWRVRSACRPARKRRADSAGRSASRREWLVSIMVSPASPANRMSESSRRPHDVELAHAHARRALAFRPSIRRRVRQTPAG